MMPKVGPRKLAIAGGLVLGAGYVLAGLTGGGDFMKILMFVGVIGGAGIGLGYVVPIAVGMKVVPGQEGPHNRLSGSGFRLWRFGLGQAGRRMGAI